MVKNQGINLAIFGPFLDLQEYFKNLGLTFKTPDPDFCDLLNELFHMSLTHFLKKKNQIITSYFKVPNKTKKCTSVLNIIKYSMAFIWLLQIFENKTNSHILF